MPFENCADQTYIVELKRIHGTMLAQALHLYIQSGGVDVDLAEEALKSLSLQMASIHLRAEDHRVYTQNVDISSGREIIKFEPPISLRYSPITRTIMSNSNG